MRQLSGVSCQVSGVTFFIFNFFLQSCGASQWRVCYQQGLPHLESTLFAPHFFIPDTQDPIIAGNFLDKAPQDPPPSPPQNCTKNWASWDSRFQSFKGPPPSQNCTKLTVREDPS